MNSNKPIEDIDVLIVGAGPAGTSTALHLLDTSPNWAQRLVIVDKAIHPREKLCGGGITHLGENVLADLGLAIDPSNFPVREVRLTYQDKSYSFFGNPVFRIVHRAEFDHWLLRQAETRGAEIRQGEGVVGVHERDTHIEVETDSHLYRAQVLVAADGSRSFVRRKLKWDGPTGVARLIEVLTPEGERPSWEFEDGVAVFDFTRMTTHQLQGYYWDFPSIVNGMPQMNRGVFDSRARLERPKADLKQTLQVALAERDYELDEYEIKGHPIRWLERQGTFSRPRVLLVGDAAGADPLFGEGISLALAYGRVAAPAIGNAFAKNDFSFADYKRRIFRDPILGTVPWRTTLAKFAYRLQSPRFFRIGWSIARFIMRFTPWNNRNFVPARRPVERT